MAEQHAIDNTKVITTKEECVIALSNGLAAIDDDDDLYDDMNANLLRLIAEKVNGGCSKFTFSAMEAISGGNFSPFVSIFIRRNACACENQNIRTETYGSIHLRIAS